LSNHVNILNAYKDGLNLSI